jgi:hypothetical protein
LLRFFFKLKLGFFSLALGFGFNLFDLRRVCNRCSLFRNRGCKVTLHRIMEFLNRAAAYFPMVRKFILVLHHIHDRDIEIFFYI